MADGRTGNLEGVKVLDPRTLEVTIEAPFPYFLSKLTYPTSYVVDRGNVEQSEGWTETPNGTGAFRLKEWQKDELLILNGMTIGMAAHLLWPIPYTESSQGAQCSCTRTAK